MLAAIDKIEFGIRGLLLAALGLKSSTLFSIIFSNIEKRNKFY
jgi:hypothetical protein